MDPEEQRKAQREQEQAELEAEMEKRRKRIEAWQAQRRKLDEDQAAAAVEAKIEEEALQKVGWTLEDDDDDDDAEDEALGNAEPEDPIKVEDAASLPKPGPFKVEDDEEDPLDAFMSTNNSQLLTASSTAAAGPQDDDVDPLDAFMASQVLPAVQKQLYAVKQEELQIQSAGPPAEETAENGEPGPSKPVKRSQRRKPSRYDSDSSEFSEEEESEEEELDDEVSRFCATMPSDMARPQQLRATATATEETVGSCVSTCTLCACEVAS